MFRYYLVRGVSAGALALLCVSKGPGASALAQEALPAIDIDAAAASGGNGAPPPPSTPTPSTWSPTLANGEPAFVERFQLPNTVSSVTREDIEEKVNIIDTEDALKYTPSLFLRKRNNGDNQAVLQTRTWGVNSSARSLVYADDLLLTALVGNDNTEGAPRWGLVSPEEIDRIDVLYGPFAAEFPGNALGGVVHALEIADRGRRCFERAQRVDEAGGAHRLVDDCQPIRGFRMPRTHVVPQAVRVCHIGGRHVCS